LRGGGESVVLSAGETYGIVLGALGAAAYVCVG